MSPAQSRNVEREPCVVASTSVWRAIALESFQPRTMKLDLGVVEHDDGAIPGMLDAFELRPDGDCLGGSLCLRLLHRLLQLGFSDVKRRWRNRCRPLVLPPQPGPVCLTLRIHIADEGAGILEERLLLE
jgi:hypothetical protein